MNAFSWIDGLVAFCLVMPAIRGWQTGLVSGLLRLAGILLGALLGWTLTSVHGVFHMWRPEVPVGSLPWISALVCAVAGWVVGSVAAWLWWRATKDQPVGWFDRIAGMALGLSKGAVFCLILLAGIQTAMPPMRAQVRQSWVGSHAVAPIVERISSWGAKHILRGNGP